MNGKLAKKLRRINREHTIGLPEVGYETVVTKESDEPVFSGELSPAGVRRPKAAHVYATKKALSANCSRKKYKIFKRMIKKVKHP